MKSVIRALAVCVCLLSTASFARAEPRTIGKLTWHTSYDEAYAEAKSQKKMLLIYFQDRRQVAQNTAFEKQALSDANSQKALSGVVRAVLPVGYEEKGKRLLAHNSFKYEINRAGLAVVDLRNAKMPYYGLVVSAHPFPSNRTWTSREVQILLGLPAGTITQRTLIYAVRNHPSVPASAWGVCNPVFLTQSNRSSQLMAAYESVGHIDYGSRVAEVSSKTGLSPMEVAAPGSGESLVDVANAIVYAWQGSGAHWGMVTSQARMFGYDMVQGRSGTWYGTGLIAP